MAATVTLQATLGNQPMAPTFIDRVRVQGDASYTAGGYALGLATKLPGKTILQAVANPQVASDWGFAYDRTNDKLKVFVLSTGLEVAGAVDLSAMDVELVVFSR